MTGALQINSYQDQNDQGRNPSAGTAQDFGQPRVIHKHGALSKGRHHRILPGAAPKQLNDIGGNVIEHEGEQRLTGVPAYLGIGRQKSPESAAYGAAHKHQRDQHRVGESISQPVSKEGGKYRAHGKLTSNAYIPEMHLERHNDSHRAQNHGNAALHRDGQGVFGADGALIDLLKGSQRIVANQQNHQHAAQHRAQDSQQPHRQRLHKGRRRFLGDSLKTGNKQKP